MKRLSYFLMGFAIACAICGEFFFDFYYENLIIMAMLVAIYFKKGEI